jgi:hypothetical protein
VQAPRRKSIDDGASHTSYHLCCLMEAPERVLFPGKCLQEKYFSDPLPPGVTRDRINSLFTAPTEKGVQTKESFKLLPSQESPNWLACMDVRPSGVPQYRVKLN